MPDFATSIEAIMPELIALRHELHRHPELGYEETWTSARILKELQSIPGLQLRTGVAGTGIIAVLNGDKPGRCVGLRAELDALPIHEENDFDYRSQIDGHMHACGHDGHMTCLIGAVRVLAKHADALPGKVKFLFQPAEETGGGGRKIVDEGALRDPDVGAVFALHGWPDHKIGEIAVAPGATLAAATSFRIEISGLGAHAAYPHTGCDVILAASQLITRLQAIVSRMTDPVDPAVVSICAIHAGATYNVLPGACTLLGTIRGLNQATHGSVLQRLRSLVASSAADLGAAGELTVVESYPVLVNDGAATRLVVDVATEMLGTDKVDRKPPPSMGAEDFSFLARAVPAAFWRLGVCPRNRDNYPMLHQPTYDFPDAAIPIGAELHCRTAERFLTQGLD